MPPQTSGHTPRFSIAEQWLIHAVMLTRLGYGSPAQASSSDPFICELAVVDKLESADPSFTRLELDRIKTVCLGYADRESTKAADRALALDVVERVNSHLHARHASTC